MLSRAFHGEPAEFQSPLSSTQALDQLQAIKKWRPDGLGLVGTVSADAIELRTAHTIKRGNGTRFEGRLEVSNSGCSLVGSFKSSPFSRSMSALFLAFLGWILAGGLLTGLQAIITQRSSLLMVLGHVVGLLLWLAMLSLIGWLIAWNASPMRSDVAAISTAIRHALLDPGKQ